MRIEYIIDLGFIMSEERKDNSEESSGASVYLVLFILGLIIGYSYTGSIAGAIISGIVFSMIPFIIMLVFGIIAVYAAMIITAGLLVAFLFGLF